MGRLVESQTSVLLYLQSVRVSLHQKLHIHNEKWKPGFQRAQFARSLNDTWNNYHVSLTAQLFPSANSLPIYPICKDSIVIRADQNWLPQTQARLAEGSHQCPDLLSLDSKFLLFFFYFNLVSVTEKTPFKKKHIHKTEILEINILDLQECLKEQKQ